MPHHIVIIEDNPHNARLAQKLLRRADPPYEVHMAEDGESGYDMALETNPDLVLVDLGLPDLDGQTVVAMLRQQPEMASIPIIAFTAWPQETAHEMAAAYGCDGVITKPIDTRSFADRIREFLEMGVEGETVPKAEAESAAASTATPEVEAEGTPETEAEATDPATNTIDEATQLSDEVTDTADSETASVDATPEPTAISGASSEDSTDDKSSLSSSE